MSVFRLLLTLCLALPALCAPAVAAPGDGDPCTAQLSYPEFSALASLNKPFFKRWAMYTRGGKYDPSQDLVYFMALNFRQGNALSTAEYAKAEALLDKVPGDSDYLAPTLEQLRPHMWKYLETLKLNTSGRADAEAYADALLPQIKPILSEALGGNRVVYAALESETQKIVRSEGGMYIVSVEGCPGRLTQFDMSDYLLFASLPAERADLRARLDLGDVRRFAAFVAGSLDDRSWFKQRLLGVLSANP